MQTEATIDGRIDASFEFIPEALDGGQALTGLL
jgi:hypothetical protein